MVGAASTVKTETETEPGILYKFIIYQMIQWQVTVFTFDRLTICQRKYIDITICNWWTGTCTNCYPEQIELLPRSEWVNSTQGGRESSLGKSEMRWILVSWEMVRKVSREDHIQAQCNRSTWAIPERLWWLHGACAGSGREGEKGSLGARWWKADCPAKESRLYSRQWAATAQFLKQGVTD